VTFGAASSVKLLILCIQAVLQGSPMKVMRRVPRLVRGVVIAAAALGGLHHSTIGQLNPLGSNARRD